MKSRASLLLMEQLIMILVFALAAAICLQIFARADSLSHETARRDGAVVLAQNAAELLKATQGEADVQQTQDTASYRLEIIEELSTCPGVAQVRIEVYDGQTLLYSLQTGWQEVLAS